MSGIRARIDFDRPSPQYSPGEEVTGKVRLLVLKESSIILGASVNLLGKVKVTYTPADRQTEMRGHRRLSSKRFGDKYNILKETKEIEDERFGEGKAFSCGIYEFPFTCTLPENIPCTFEGPFGWIRYRMEVILRYSFWDHRCEAEADVLVSGHYDLSNLDESFHKVQVMNKGTSFNNENGTGYLEINFELEKMAYAIGETIKFAATVDFSGNRRHYSVRQMPIEGAKVALVQEQTYKIKEKIKHHYVKLQEVQGPLIFPDSIEVWNGSMYLLPIPPTGLGGSCRLIDINYHLVARIDPPTGAEGTTSMTVRLQIGTLSISDTDINPSSSGDEDRDRPPPPPFAEMDDFRLSVDNDSATPTMTVTPTPEIVEEPQPQPSPSSSTPHFLDVQPGPSRRASAPPTPGWVQDFYSTPVAGTSASARASAPVYGHSLGRDSPPPSYTDALILSTPFPPARESPDSENGAEDDDMPPEYSTQPPYFLRKGAKHLFDNYNVYSTL